MRSAFLLATLLLLSCSGKEAPSATPSSHSPEASTSETQPSGTEDTPEPATTAAEEPPPQVSPADWKVKDAEAAMALFESCKAVQDGKLKLIVESVASPAEPAWTIGLQIDSPENPTFLDHCEVDAATGKIICSGGTCP